MPKIPPNFPPTARVPPVGNPASAALAAVEKIARLDPLLHAWVCLDPSAAEQPPGEGPLAGLTLGIKDIIDVRGLPTRAGSSILAAAEPAMDDARCVALLRNAGAVILGKTATTAFAYYDPAPTRNPRILAHSPGGSSSGSAAAVAAGMCDAALGTQTFGSVIRPAAFCGVFALKPGYGAISGDGILPLAESLDHVGVFARSAEVARQVARVLMAAPLDQAPLHGGTIGVPGRYFTAIQDETVREGYRAGLAALSRAGFRNRPVTLPPAFESGITAALAILRVEAVTFHRRWFPKRRREYGTKMAELLDAGLAISDRQYSEARRDQFRATGEMLRLFEEVEFLATPSTPSLAPEGLAWTGDPVFNTPFSVFGLPVINLPAAYATNGLCSGLQIAGPPGSEARLLQLAVQIEQSGFGVFVPPGLG